MLRLAEDCPRFDALKDTLTAGHGQTDDAALAAMLGLSEGAARVAVHRLRKRHRLLIREEVSRTGVEEDAVEPEMRARMDALFMIVAIRGKDETKLRSYATDRINGWPDALPTFALGMREQ